MLATLEVAPGKPLATAPGVFPRLPAPERLTHMLCEVVPLGGGTFRLKPRPMLDWVGLSRDSLDALGISLSESTLRRLGRAGFIRIRPISPSRYEFNVTSFLDHCRAVEADPEEFWHRPDARGKTNWQKYQQDAL